MDANETKLPPVDPVAAAMEAQHTPSPWTCELARVVSTEPVFGFRITGGTDKWHSIAGCAVYEPHNADCFTPAEMEANAHLIAAAPDLLDALKTIRDRVRTNGRLGGWNSADLGWMNAVIRKAEGTAAPADRQPGA